LERVLGARFDGHDDGSAPGMVDGYFALPDATRGVLEVTTLGDPAAMELGSVLASRRGWRIEGSRWAWDVRVPTLVRVRELEHHLPVVARACENAGVTLPALLDTRADPATHVAAEWLRNARVQVEGFPGTDNPGAVYALADADGGGMIDDAMPGFVEWLEEQFQDEPLRGHVAKLVATGVAERHLFLRVHGSGIPEEHLVNLAFSNGRPTERFDSPGDLSGLWLVGEWSSTALHWTGGDGWRREALDA
jgi:hypothetical protein